MFAYRRIALSRTFLAALVVAASGCKHNVDPRLETPKSTVKALMQAEYDNDIGTVRKCVLPGDDQARAAEAYTALTYAMRRAGDSAYKRFGDEFRSIASNVDFTRPNFALLDVASIVQSGESATIQMPTSRMPFHLKRVQGEWKADLVSSLIPKDTGLTDEQARAAMARLLTAQARGADLARAEIDNGAYSDAGSALKAISAHMLQEQANELQRLEQEFGAR